MRKGFWGLVVIHLLFMVSCSKVDDVNIDVEHLIEIKHLTFNIDPPILMGDDSVLDENGELVSITRAGMDIINTVAQTYFEHNDTLGIFPDSGYQIPFIPPIAEGDTAHKVDVVAQGWMTKDSILYAAYLPFNFYNRYYDKVPWSFFRKTPMQMENGAGSTNAGESHINAQMLLGSLPTLPEGNGGLAVTVRHQGSIIRVQARMPLGGTFVKAVLACSKSNAFMTHGKLNMFAPGGEVITPEGYTNYMTLLFNNFTVESRGVLTFYFVAPPTNIVGEDLTLYVWDSYGNCYSGPKTLSASAGNWYKNSYIRLTYTNLTAEYNVPAVYLTPYEYEIEYDTGVALGD